jgi:hypothetical protein
MGFNNFYDLDKGDLNKASEKNTEHRLGRYVFRKVNNSDYTMVVNQDHFIEFENLSGNRTLNLPDINTVKQGQTYIIMKDGSGHTVTLDPFSSQTINGSASYHLSGSHTSVNIVANSIGWKTW